MFRGRKLLIATKHRKEEAIAPLLREKLGVQPFVAKDLDTDLLGTFTGEVERTMDPVATARQKCEMALQLHGDAFDLVIASEGSFGPHPALAFVPADEEVLLLLDRKNELEIVARALSTETNFAGEYIHDEAQLWAFAARAGFPSHALVLRQGKDSATGICKGVTDKAQLLDVFRQLRHSGAPVYLETDMRAMYNPSRMAVIRQATKKLLDLLNARCPRCQTPGFAVTSVKRGLPCRQCGLPTQSILSATSTCNKCAYATEQLYPHNTAAANPACCDFCNP